MDKKTIRFIDSHYKDLFHIPDGGRIKITRSNGEELIRQCKYIDDYHLSIHKEGDEYGNTFHICEFAEICERNGSAYEPIIENEYSYENKQLERLKDVIFAAKTYGNIEADKFFKSSNGFTEMFYNPDATAGGQVVINEISNALIKEAAQFKTSDAFFEHLNEGCNQSLIDAGTPAFRSAVKELVESKADLEGINKATMKGLIKAAGIKPKSKETER